MSLINDSISNIRIEDRVMDLLWEIEELYLTYLNSIKLNEYIVEQRFLRVYQREELKSTCQLESISSLVAAYYADNPINLELEKIIRNIYKNGRLENDDLNKIHRLIMISDARNYIKVGQFRDIPVKVGKFKDGDPIVAYSPPEPSEIPYLMNEVLEFYNENVSLDEKIRHPFINSAIIHAFTVLIHPYQDGNGRISRLLHHTKLWQLTQKKYNIKLYLPAFYFSEQYAFVRNSYTKKLHGIHSSNFSNESWNSWFHYNLMLMYEKLPLLTEDIRQIKRINQKGR